MISIIFWILVSYIIYILFYALHTKNNFSFVKRFLFKKMLMYVVIVFLICCTTELIKNEIYTFKYGEPFKNADLHINMMGDEEYFKVLDYSDDMAYIYYVSDEMSSASIVCFRYIDN